MSKKKIEKTDNNDLTLPALRWWHRVKDEKLNFSISKKLLLEVIILFVILLFAVGCFSQKQLKSVACDDGTRVISGWISAESNSKYWIVSNDGGATMEFGKYMCSIKG